MQLPQVEAVVVPPHMSYDAVTTSKNSVSTTVMSYYVIIRGRSGGIDTSNEL